MMNNTASEIVRSKKSILIFLVCLIALVLVIFKIMEIQDKERLTEEDESPSSIKDMRGHPDFNKIRQWLETVPALTAQDADRTKKFLTPLDNPSLVEIRRQFYSIVNMPLQNVCTVGKFFGGIWMDNHGCLDGHKYVCMDKFYGDIISGNCLIYSFGINDEWSFEEGMAQLGCTIRTFDPTIDGSTKPNTDLIIFKKIGMKEYSGDAKGLGQVLTLKDAVQLMGDAGRKISYLKVDIEGSELEAIPEWIGSGILKDVDQIGFEIHIYGKKGEELRNQMIGVLNDLKKLHELGFRLISSQNNECMGKNLDIEHRYLNFIELVFYKQN